MNDTRMKEQQMKQSQQLMGAELLAHGLEVHLFDWRDPCDTDTRWMLAWKQTTLDVDGFRKLVAGIVDPLGGEVLEWGAVNSADELAAWQASDGCCGG